MTIRKNRSDINRGLLAIILLGQMIAAESVSAQDADAIAASRMHQQEAFAAYQQDDFGTFISHTLQAAELRPSHPGLMYNLAIGYARNGQPDKAIEWLARYATTGSVADMNSENLKGIEGADGIDAVRQMISDNSEFVSNSSVAFALDENDILAEGIAYDSQSGDFFISSVHKRKIIRISPSGEQSDFAADDEGVTGILSIRADPQRRRLWAGSAALDQVENLKPAEIGSSAVLEYDLDTGELLRRYELSDGSDHIFGDLTTSSDGTVYVSDSRSPAVYVIAHGSDSLAVFASGNAFFSPQGLAFSPNELYLYLADYSVGIVRIDMESGRSEVVPHVEGATLLGIDGLVYVDGGLIGIQNGINPNRIIRMHLSAAMDAIENVSIVEANNPIFDEPTQGVLVGDRYYYIANSQWGSFGDDGKVIEGLTPEKPTILVTNF